MFDEIALVQSDEESPFVQSNPKPAKTVQAKREQFRYQIRKSQIDDILEQKRMWFQPKQRFQKQDALPNIAEIFNSFRTSVSMHSHDDIAQHLHTLSTIIDDRNRVNSLFLTQRNFLQFKILLEEETYYIDTYTIYGQLTQDEEFFTLNQEDIVWTIERSLVILGPCQDDELYNSILGYLANVASKMQNIQLLLLEKNAIKLLKYKQNLQTNLCHFIQTICQKIPEQHKSQLQNAIQVFDNLEQSSQILQSFYVIIRQADYMSEINYDSIIKFLLSYIFDYLKNEEDYESFYSALVQLKCISDYSKAQIYDIFMQYGMIDVINKLINYKYQKIRTAGLYILKNLIKSGHFTIQKIFSQEDLMKKLINILTADKPVNKSLVLQSIIHILKYGNDSDCVHLLDMGLAMELSQILQSQDAYILLQGIECTAFIMAFGQQLQSTQNISNPILKKLMDFQVIKVIQNLQHHPNQEVFIQVQKFLNMYFNIE